MGAAFKVLTETWVGPALLALLLLLIFLWVAGFLFRYGWDAAGSVMMKKRAEAERVAREAQRDLPNLRKRLKHLEQAGPPYRANPTPLPSGKLDDDLMKWKTHARKLSAQVYEKERAVAAFERRYGPIA